MSLGAVGFTVSNIIHTIKRLFVVSYPPVIAIYLLDAELPSLFPIIYCCFFGAAFVSLIVFVKRTRFQKIFARQIHTFGSGGSLWKFWTWVDVTHWSSRSENELNQVDWKLFFAAAWIYFFFGSVFFLVNVLGFYFRDYSAVILQLSGVFNAMGTLVLAFYLDPVLARVFERDRKHADTALRSVLLAQIANFCVLSPLFFYILSRLLFSI